MSRLDAIRKSMSLLGKDLKEAASATGEYLSGKTTTNTIRKSMSNFNGAHPYAALAGKTFAAGIGGGLAAKAAPGDMSFSTGFGIGALGVLGHHGGNALAVKYGKNITGGKIGGALLGGGVGGGLFSMLNSNNSVNGIPGIPNTRKRMTPQERLKYNQAMLSQKLKYNTANDVRRTELRIAESKIKKQLWDARQRSRRRPTSWSSDRPWN